MKRWRSLHKLTYVIAAALLIHVILVGDVGAGVVLITLGFVGRIPVVRRWLMNRHAPLRPRSAIQRCGDDANDLLSLTRRYG